MKDNYGVKTYRRNCGYMEFESLLVTVSYSNCYEIDSMKRKRKEEKTSKMGDWRLMGISKF